MNSEKIVAISHKVSALSQVKAAAVVARQLDSGEEVWIFVVLMKSQLDNVLKARITEILNSVNGLESTHGRIFELSSLPVTRNGRVMRRALERFVNHQAVPNRSIMRNPGLLNEIADVVGWGKSETLGTIEDTCI